MELKTIMKNVYNDIKEFFTDFFKSVFCYEDYESEF